MISFHSRLTSHWVILSGAKDLSYGRASHKQTCVSETPTVSFLASLGMTL
jgi:hypothetical protein